MKRINHIVVIILIVSVLFGCGVQVFAANIGFSTGSISEEEKQRIAEFVNFYVIKDELPRRAITCFDVNEKGEIAVGISSVGTKNTILIYNEFFEFQYGYNLELHSSFGLRLYNDYLVVYAVKGKHAFLINQDGELEDISVILDTKENRDYWEKFVWAKQRTVNGKTYELKDDPGVFNFFSNGYTKLVETSPNGESRVLYDASADNRIKMGLLKFAIIGFALFSAATIKYNMEESKREDKA